MIITFILLQIVLAYEVCAGALQRQTAMVTIDTGTKYQTIDGFGFSEAFGYAKQIQATSPNTQASALSLLFSLTGGAGMSILRNRIPEDPYTGIEPSGPSSSNGTPIYRGLDGDDGQLEFTKSAINSGVQYIYGNAWSAPPFMKTSNSTSGGYLCGVDGETCSSGSWLQAYANFLVKYVQDYAAEGINITHLGFLNEPDGDAFMESNGDQAADFIKVLKPTVKSAGLNMHLTCCDALGWSSQQSITAQLSSSGVEKDLGVITSHAYTGQASDVMADTGLPTWISEDGALTGPFTTDWYSDGGSGEGLTWANRIFTALVDGGVSAYLYWIGVKDSDGTNGMLIEIDDEVLTPSARLWAFALFSRFVRPGARRVAVSGAPSGFNISAFINPDKSVSVQLINNNSDVKTIAITVSGSESVSGTYISQSSDGISYFYTDFGRGIATADYQPYSMTTLVFKS